MLNPLQLSQPETALRDRPPPPDRYNQIFHHDGTIMMFLFRRAGDWMRRRMAEYLCLALML